MAAGAAAEMAAVAADTDGAPAELNEAGPVGTAEAAEEAQGAAPREAPEGGGWPDATAEAAFLADARSRGEVPRPAQAREEIAEETGARPLPALDELVQRIPPGVRETLDELFRAKFVRVARVPRKALKATIGPA